MPTTDYNLHAVKHGGSITEDVLQEIFDITPIDLYFTDKAGSSSVHNDHFSWMEDELNPIDKDAAREDASDSTGNDHVEPERVWNNTQMKTRICSIGDRAQNVDSIGVQSLMSDSVAKRNKEIRRDFEATFLSDNASVRAASGTPATTAGAAAFIKTHAFLGASGAVGGFDPDTGLVDAPTHGDVRAMTEALLIQAEEETYEDGGEPNVLLSSPALIGKMARYFASNTGQAATLYSNVSQSEGGMTVKGAIKVIEGQHLTFEVVSSRELQKTQTDTGVALFGFDFDFWEVATLKGIHGYRLAKIGLKETRELMGDKGVKCLNERASFVIDDIDFTEDMTA